MELVREERREPVRTERPRDERRETPPSRGPVSASSRPMSRPPDRHVEARTIGAQVAHEHQLANADIDGPLRETPRPPLEGAQSLRDALKQVAVSKTEKKEEPPVERKVREVHASDLKSTLGAVVSHPVHRDAPEAPRHREEYKQEPEVRTNDRQTPPVQQAPEPPPDRQPAGLPEDVMRTMLAVDGFDANGKST